MSFSMEISSWANKAEAKIEENRRGIILSLFGSVIMATPVGTSDPKTGYTGGRLRGNWQTSVGQPKTGELDLRPEGAAVEEMNGVILSMKGDGVAYLVNNLPYAYRIEYEGWSKIKAPQGMVRINVARFTQLSSRAASGVI